ncbi:MAG: hypothetical protein ACOC5E_00185, partial [Acidobacteriota bacterium]
MRFTESEIDWATRLRGAGLQWDPQPGHYVFDIDGMIKSGSPFQAGVFLITSLNAFEALVGGPHEMQQSFAWLPTWEDAREWLQDRGVGDEAAVKSLGQGLAEGLTDRELMEKVVRDRHEGLELEERSDAYVEARFDALGVDLFRVRRALVGPG